MQAFRAMSQPGSVVVYSDMGDASPVSSFLELGDVV